MKRLAQRGFTMVEMIVVMVVIGVLSGIVAVFIRAPIAGYVDSVGRAQLTEQADLALRRIARDLRLALPNSIRVVGNGEGIEFLMTKSGGRYLAAEDGLANADPTKAPYALDFVNNDGTEPHRTFAVVGALPRLAQQIAQDDYVVVYNLGDGFAPANAYDFGKSSTNIAKVEKWTQVTAPNGDKFVTSITLRDNPFARQSPQPMPSPTQRFQLVSGPVMYYCGDDGTGKNVLRRYSGYNINATPVVPSASATQKPVLASGLAHCDELFFYSTTSQRIGLVVIWLTLQVTNATDSAISLVHQVHVDNTP